MILLLKSYPYHFVYTILSVPFCPIPFCPYTILSIPFCPYHFVRYHFVLEPFTSYGKFKDNGGNEEFLKRKPSSPISTSSTICRKRQVTDFAPSIVIVISKVVNRHWKSSAGPSSSTDAASNQSGCLRGCKRKVEVWLPIGNCE